MLHATSCLPHATERVNPLTPARRKAPPAAPSHPPLPRRGRGRRAGGGQGAGPAAAGRRAGGGGRAQGRRRRQGAGPGGGRGGRAGGARQGGGAGGARRGAGGGARRGAGRRCGGKAGRRCPACGLAASPSACCRRGASGVAVRPGVAGRRGGGVAPRGQGRRWDVVAIRGRSTAVETAARPPSDRGCGWSALRSGRSCIANVHVSGHRLRVIHWKTIFCGQPGCGLHFLRALTVDNMVNS